MNKFLKGVLALSLFMILLLSLGKLAFAGGVNTQAQQAQQAYSGTSNYIDTSETSHNSTDVSRGVGYAPSMNGTVGTFVCDSHAGVSAGWSGLGFGVQIPLSDKKCNLRQDALALKQLHSVASGRELLCTDVAILRATIRASSPCFIGGDEELLSQLTDAELNHYHNLQANKIKDDAYIQQRLDEKVNRMFQKSLEK